MYKPTSVLKSSLLVWQNLDTLLVGSLDGFVLKDGLLEGLVEGSIEGSLEGSVEGSIEGSLEGSVEEGSQVVTAHQFTSVFAGLVLYVQFELAKMLPALE